jgi:hypothetical protein
VRQTIVCTYNPSFECHVHWEEESMNKPATPSDLAKEPLRVQLEPGEYSFESQTRSFSTPTAASMTTFGGTRTYDSRGNPRDNDND